MSKSVSPPSHPSTPTSQQPAAAMSSVIRIKRKVGEDPQHALLATKRRRLDSGDGASAAIAPQNTLFQFVGTMTPQETALPDAALTAMHAQRKSGAARRDPLSVAAAIEKAKKARRARLQHEQKARRFRIVSRRRGEPGTDAAHAVGGLAGVNDYEEDSPPAGSAASAAAPAASEVTCNGQVLERVAVPDSGFVYDLYVTTAPLAGDDDDLLELRPCDNVMLWEHRAAHDSDSDDPFADDADDSNDEGNWRNDYPEELGDSDYEHYLDPDAGAEFDLIRRMEAHEIGADGDDDEPLAYGLDELERDCGDDPYERYKARVMREMTGEDSDSDRDGGYLADSADSGGDEDD